MLPATDSTEVLGPGEVSLAARNRSARTQLALIVDDDPVQRAVACHALAACGLRIEEAEDGAAGLAAFERLQPNIVLLDVVMPVMDGFEVCTQLRRLASGAHTPVLMMTGLDDRSSIERAYEVGATDFISKPISSAMIGHRVRYMLRSAQLLKDLARSEASLADASRLASSQRFLETLINAVPNPVLVKDSEHRFVLVNAAFCRLMQRSREELIGKTNVELQPDELVQSWHAEDERALAADETLFFERRSVGPHGENVWGIASKCAISAPDGKRLIVVLITDVTALKESERALLDSNEKLQEINRVMFEAQAQLAFTNEELEQHRHHLEELVVSRTSDLAKANEAAELAHRAGKERLLMETEAKMQSRKLEAMGTLAAGIAHDFNNILGSIAGFAEMTADDLADGSSAKRNVEQILSASFRARDLIARMLAFARQSPVEPVAVDMVIQVREVLALLRASLPPSVELSFRSGMDAATVHADPTQIQQIVMNLCINAAHAMGDHGTISIAIDPARKIKGARPEHIDGICLTVADSGTGMTPAVLERMFDPFFTTKAPDKGSGLGLSVVYGVVTDLGGVIEVQSRVEGSNTGTEFRVFLPAEANSMRTGR